LLLLLLLVIGGLLFYASTPHFSNLVRQRVVNVLQDEGLARRMGKAGRQKVVREFTWRAVAARIDSIYGEVMAR